MKMNRVVGTLLGGAALLVGSACADLEVTNPNSPDIDRALASPEDVINIANSTLFNWYRSVTATQPFTGLSVTADMHTSNFGNFAMRFGNVEPRIKYDNNSAGSDEAHARIPWANAYADLGLGNDVLRALAAGVDLGGAAENAKYAALARFTQAASLSTVAQLFDQGFVVTEETNLEEAPVLLPYTEVGAAAEAAWDQVIADLAGQNASYATDVLPLTNADGEYSLQAGNAITVTSSVLAQIANTMAARHIAYMPRNPAENAAANWGKVLQYAEKGISAPSNRFDFAIEQDGGTKWFSYIVYYGSEKSWLRVDMRLINLMNPAAPAKYSGTMVPQGTSPDARYTSDFGWDGRVEGDVSRGVYMQSPFWHKRYDYAARLSPTLVQGPAPYILAAENDLLIAEALVRTNGDLARAATLINNSRVTRGKLPPATAAEGAAKLLQYIDYERQVELITTGGIEFYDARRFGRLQPLAYLHLPVPARELETLSLPLYTFGGADNPEMRKVRSGGLSLMRSGSSSSVRGERPLH